MARGDARLAAGARVEIDLEGVLLPGLGGRERNQVVIEAGGKRRRMLLVLFRKDFNGGETLLLLEERKQEVAGVRGRRSDRTTHDSLFVSVHLPRRGGSEPWARLQACLRDGNMEPRSKASYVPATDL